MRFINLYNKVQYENAAFKSEFMQDQHRIVEAMISYTPFNSKLDLKDSFIWDCIISFAKN